MAKALSVDLRRRVVDAVEGGASCRAAAARFGVGLSSAIRRVQRFRECRRFGESPADSDARQSALVAPSRQCDTEAGEARIEAGWKAADPRPDRSAATRRKDTDGTGR